MASAPPQIPLVDQDNRPQLRWPRRRAAYEQWYAIVFDPQARRALWLRYTLLKTRSGYGEGRVWAVVVDDDKAENNVFSSCSIKLEQLNTSNHSFGVWFGDLAELSNHKARGCVSTPRGNICWDLQITPAQHSFRAVDSTVARLLTASQHVSPNSSARVRGHYSYGLQRFDLEDAAMTQGHCFGKHMHNAWAWGSCPRFDQAPACSFEAVALTRPGHRDLLSCELVIDGKVYAFNHLKQIFGLGLWPGSHANRAEVEAGRFSFRASCPELCIEGHFSVDTGAYRPLRYRDVDDSAVYNCNRCLGSLHLEVFWANGERRSLHCQGRAAVEFAARKPLCLSAEDFVPTW